ncbi:type II toxin-antitoxin system VapC family toxin [Cellulosimicrobium protaetiae]|uniref:Ribonuclease VapC n=1 Tax=Cellulosimicrobium protaetiae TaxID=2587808 RepID=A0A6M5U8Q2_9MICO|nr:type II toxin-antitoxin system VapC family toxin [Cellulosimicrobium protaetiae]QJW34897.1 type II toxin-antitoxin system VapC family toxin [Cellulosimicrobium protaetiae]
MRVVLDASAAVDALLPTARHDAVLDQLDRLVAAELVTPSLVDTEVLSALARLERAGTITAAVADAAVARWSRLPCERVDTTALLPDVWSLRGGLRVSDAHYVALALRLDATLLTTDARLARSPVAGLSVLLAG